MMSKKSAGTWLQYCLFIGVGLFLVWWQLKTMTPVQKEEFKIALQQANYWYVFPIIFMSLTSHYIRSVRWKLLLETMDYYPKTRNVFAAVMVGYLANSAVPRLGEVLKCSILVRYEKLKLDKLVGTVLVERTIDLICFILFVALTIAIQYKKLTTFLQEQLSIFNGGDGSGLSLKILLIIYALVAVILVIKRLVKKYPKNKLIIWLRNFLKGMADGFLTVIRLKRKRKFLLLTLLMWSLYLLQIYVGFFALTKTAGLGIEAACSVLTLVTLAMIITPGGIGAFPIFVMQVLLIYGISRATGQAFGWLMWGISTAIIVVAGFASLLLLPYFSRGVRRDSTRHVLE